MEVDESSVLIVGDPQGILCQHLRPHTVPLLIIIITLPYPTRVKHVLHLGLTHKH